MNNTTLYCVVLIFGVRITIHWLHLKLVSNESIQVDNEDKEQNGWRGKSFHLFCKNFAAIQ